MKEVLLIIGAALIITTLVMLGVHWAWGLPAPRVGWLRLVGGWVLIWTGAVIYGQFLLR